MDNFNNDIFTEEFERCGFPDKYEYGILEFTIGDSLIITLDFNVEYFNFFPMVKLILNNDKKTEVFDIGSSFSYRFIHERINEENMEEAFNNVQNLIDDIEHFSSRLSIGDLNEDTFRKKVSRIFERNKFYYS